jgi:hypothetical protein
MVCRVCAQESPFFAKGKILNKYEISYFKCQNCGFVQTEEPYWLDESYSEAINRSDVGYVARNEVLSKVTKALIKRFFDTEGRFLDYGTGYGLFVRLMRDFGFNFYGVDKYCDIVFAKDFEIKENESGFELVTAFELFEHLVDPFEEMKKLTAYSDSIFFSTELYPASSPKPGEWWYFGLEHGQHLSLYSAKSLSVLAERFGLNLYTNNKNLHLFTKKKINKAAFSMLSAYNKYLSYKKFNSKNSLRQSDYDLINKRLESTKSN